MKRLVLTALVAGGLAVGIGSASAGTEAGRMEVGGAFTMMVPVNGGDSRHDVTFFGAVSLGYFVTDALEIKLSALILGKTGTDSGVAFGAMAGPDYHFNTKGKLVPYVGVYGGGLGYSGGGNFIGIVDGHVGLKQFVGERTAITYQVSYQYMFSGSSGADQGQVVGTIGLAYLF